MLRNPRQSAYIQTCPLHLFPSSLRPVSFLFPLLELFLQMLLQPRKLVPKIPPTPPAHQIPPQELLFQPLPPIFFPHWKVINIDQERCSKAVVVFPMPHALAMPIHAQDVNMEM